MHSDWLLAGDRVVSTHGVIIIIMLPNHPWRNEWNCRSTAAVAVFLQGPASSADSENACPECINVFLQEPLPPGAVLGSGKPSGKGLVQDPYNNSSKPQQVDIYSVMTYQPLTEYEQQR
jgi:hypothetical protein